jgi:hypothetical protein
MRRTLALAAAAVALAAPVASAAPPDPLAWCDVAQNCVCAVVNAPVELVVGRPLFYCV